MANVYPSWRYHPEQKPRLVQGPKDDEALAAVGWVDTPAKFPEANPEPKPKPKRKPRGK